MPADKFGQMLTVVDEGGQDSDKLELRGMSLPLGYIAVSSVHEGPNIYIL